MKIKNIYTLSIMLIFFSNAIADEFAYKHSDIEEQVEAQDFHLLYDGSFESLILDDSANINMRYSNMRYWELFYINLLFQEMNASYPMSATDEELSQIIEIVEKHENNNWLKNVHVKERDLNQHENKIDAILKEADEASKVFREELENNQSKKDEFEIQMRLEKLI